jgi:hypothetical protein
MATLKAELESMAQWMDSPSAEDLASAWEKKAAAAVIDMTAGLDLKACIQRSNFGAYKTALSASVDAAVVRSLQQTSPQNRTPCKPQHLLRPENFLTASEWDRLQRGSPAERLQVLLRRALLLGIRSLSEQTVKHAVALLLSVSATQTMPSYAEIFRQVGVFKRTFEEQKARWPVAAPGTDLLKFPETAQELPDEIFAAAYPCPDDKPADRTQVCQKDVWLAQIPLRATSALLKNTERPSSGEPRSEEPARQDPTVTAVLQALRLALPSLADRLPSDGVSPETRALPSTTNLRTDSCASGFASCILTGALA